VEVSQKNRKQCESFTIEFQYGAAVSSDCAHSGVAIELVSVFLDVVQLAVEEEQIEKNNETRKQNRLKTMQTKEPVPSTIDDQTSIVSFTCCIKEAQNLHVM